MPSIPPLRPFRFPAWAGALAIFGLAFLAFWPAVHGAILWDDPAHILLPEYESAAGWWRMVTTLGVTQEYYPGLFSAFWLEHHLWGNSLPAYHLLNIALHAGSACLLALVLRRLWMPGTAAAPGRSDSAAVLPGCAAPAALPRNVTLEASAWFAGALFAVHPVAVESVAWMTEQKNTLSLFFYLLAALLYLRFHERRAVSDYLLATLVFVLALSAKTATFTLPPALLVVAWWQRGRIDWRRDLVPLLPWFGFAFAAGLVTVYVETNLVGAKGASYALTFGERLLLAPRIVWFYVAKDLWPHDVLFFYPRWNVAREAVGWWPYALAVVGVTVGLWLLRRRARGPLAGWFLFLGAMFPVIGFFNVFAFLFSYVADHFQYMPCLTLVATMTGVLGYAVAALGPALRRTAAILAFAVVAAFVVQTRRASALYRSNETLFGHVIAKNPDSWMAHQILASALAKSGRAAEAMTQYREVIRLKPDHPDAYLGLGALLAKRPETKAEAIPLYERALALREHYVEAHYALGVALADDPARREQAMHELESAVGLQPRYVPAQIALGSLLAQDRARLPEALEHLRAALQIEPNNGAAHRAYADGLARSGALDEAGREYERALQLDPGDAVAHFHFGDVLARQRGRAAEAISHYEAALKLDPSRPDAHNTLGILYIQRGDAARAREQWEAALRIDPGYRDARANLQRLEQMMK